MVVFDNRQKTGKKKKAKKVQELLNLVEEVVRKNNKKPFMVDLSHETRVSFFVFFFLLQCSVFGVFCLRISNHLFLRKTWPSLKKRRKRLKQ